jgi:putative ABC transport system permease protein
MNMIRELAGESIKSDRKSSIAVKVSIFIAVILIGFFLIVFSINDYEQAAYLTKTTGGHSAELLAIKPEAMAKLKMDHRVKRLAVIQREELEDTSLKHPQMVINYLDAYLYNYQWVELASGRYPETSGELLVSELFLKENPGLKIGSAVTIAEHRFQICGTFKEYLFSFEGTYTGFGWIDSTKTDVSEPVDLCIWLENERATYQQIPALVQKLELDPVKLEKEGGLAYNKAYLQAKMIFPGGILKPPGEVAETVLLRSFALFCLLLLFILIINNAFSVWNERDLKQIGLLKSCGMSKAQVKRFVVEKALLLSLQPILLGLVASYLLTLLLFYLFKITYTKYHLASAPMDVLKIPFVPLARAALPVLCLALLVVFLASLKPARKSSELSVVNAIKNLDPERSLKLKDIRYTSNIEQSLAKEYSSSYGKTYRGMGIALALACLIFSMALIIQSFNHLNERYNTYQSPYNINVSFVTLENADPDIITQLKGVGGVSRLVLYRNNRDLIFLESDNPRFLSDEKSSARARLKEDKKPFDVPVSVYGIDDREWNRYCDEHGLKSCSSEAKGGRDVLLLDRIAEDPGRPCLRSKHIPLTDKAISEIHLRREANTQAGLISLHIADSLTEVPFGIAPLPQQSISLFMPMSSFNTFAQDSGFDLSPGVKSYNISITANEKMLDEATRIMRQTVYQYIPKTDARVESSSDLERLSQENSANTKILFIFIQSFLLFVGLSNAYNSFNSNLQARRRDFALLRSIGMQEQQLKKMLFYEGGFLLRKVMLIFFLSLIALVTLFAYQKRMLFAPWEIFTNLNFLLLFAFLGINAIGIYAAIKGGIRRALSQDIQESLREN